ncbi:type V CRISPR-associated protein Cas4 [uncultured Sneathia sp.]|uniref:type V CRISPR-associated protein Cas4 n=1 Tax=uncultured Sneathia sp. TaxID=278067 RepID=UPI002595ED55|nr:type V CRISPR-associated protein Cas4 [uncultured Sneathia sp.]
MENTIKISNLNDYIFCPISIYFHNLYGDMDTIMYQMDYQINGKFAHKTIDTNTYSTRKDVITSLDVYSEKYNLTGKIDIYDKSKMILIERKNKVSEIYDGYIFQLYAQYFCMIEMGYKVEKLQIYSISDNKKYDIKLPKDDVKMFSKFEEIVNNINLFEMEIYS